MLSNALAVTRRELRDSLRDWRIVAPIALLTLGFPWVMLALSQIAFTFARQYDEQALFVTVIPFSTMIVGFFPISFCLVIALETFVGEKERSSLEPLLAMPISDTELYGGKLLASLALPLLAGYLGMAVFIAGLKFSRGLDVPALMLLQVVLLTGLEALLMVSGAVVVSSHTTSVRAANLLASFIIVPMTLLVQLESVLLLNNLGNLLWHVMAGLVVANLIVGRTGMRLFNREEILARETDELNLRGLGRTFWGFMTEGRGRFSLIRFYRTDFFNLLGRNRNAIVVTTMVMAGGMALGALLAFRYPMPSGALGLDHLDAAAFRRSLAAVPSTGVLPSFDTQAIFTNNVGSLAGAGLLGLFSFGALALILLLIPMGIVGFFTGEVWLMGANPLQFLTAFILPHGILELPAAVLATALALQMGASLISPRTNLTAGQGLLTALADFVRAFIFVIIPVLLIAAFVEANITPEIVIRLYGN